MNEKCFQFYMKKDEAQKSDFINRNAKFFMKTEDEAEKFIDVLLSNWKLTTENFLNNLSIACRRQNIWPWAIVLYEKEFELAGHVVSIRQRKKDFSFGSYSLESGQFSVNDGVPPFSFLLVNEKVALAEAAKKSLLFEQAWNLLKNKDESLNWICLPSAPPDEWVKKKSEGNDKLFMSTINKISPILPVSTLKPPRKVLAEHFESLGGELPISGGWGYTKEDACIIEKNDPFVDPLLPFDGVGVEYVFVEKRIYEEMIIFRPEGEKFSGIKWNLKEQSLIEEAMRNFDRLVFEITAFRDNDWEELKAEFEGPKGYGTPGFDQEAHEKKRQEKMVRFTREFWFDVTSFFGQGVVITDKSTGNKKLFSIESFKFTDKFKKLLRIGGEPMSTDPYQEDLEKVSKDSTIGKHSSLVKYTVLLPLVVSVWFSEAFIFFVLWRWFLVPIGISNISYVHAFGIYILWSFIKAPNYRKSRSEESVGFEYWKGYVFHHYTVLLTVLVLAWPIYLILQKQ